MPLPQDDLEDAIAFLERLAGIRQRSIETRTDDMIVRHGMERAMTAIADLIEAKAKKQKRLVEADLPQPGAPANETK